MGKTTYLLGAGASSNKLPLVKDIPVRLSVLRDKLELYKPENPFQQFHQTTDSVEIVRKNIVKAINDLAYAIDTNESYSIDDFAERYSADQDFEKLLSLKVILSFLLIHEQLGAVADYRYESFLTSISDGFIGNWKNVRVLTWNYDYQFELALRSFNNQEKRSLKTLQGALRSQPNSITIRDYSNQFSIYKLNGTLAFFDSFPEYAFPLDDISRWTFESFAEKFISYYHIVISSRGTKLRPSLYFAWEEQKIVISLVEVAMKAISDTEDFVIIGYTFPPVNRDIDKRILGCLGDNCNIHIQDLNCDPIIESFKRRTRGREFNIYPSPITDIKTTKFFLP